MHKHFVQVTMRLARIIAISSFAAVGLLGCVATYTGPAPNLQASTPAAARKEIEDFTMAASPGMVTVYMGRETYDPSSVGFVFESVSPEARKKFETGRTWRSVSGGLFSAGATLATVESLLQRDGLKSTKGKIALGLVGAALAADFVGYSYTSSAVTQFNATLRAKLAPALKTEGGSAALTPGITLGAQHPL